MSIRPTFFLIGRHGAKNDAHVTDGIRFPRQHSLRDRDPSGRPAGPGHGRYFGPLRQGLLIAGQKEEIRNKSAQKNTESRI